MLIGMLEQAVLVTGMAAAPVGESRLSVIYGLAIGMDPLLVVVLSLAGNMAVAPILFALFRRINLHRIADRLFGHRLDRIIKKADHKLKDYGTFALIPFVAVPLPGSGAWTAAVIAEIFDIDRKKATIVISLGVVIATALVFAGATGAFAALKSLFPS